MGDPISIIGVVVDLAPRVIKYIIDVKHASRDRQALLTEVTSTSGILSMLKNVIDQPDGDHTWAREVMTVDGMREALMGVQGLLRTLAEELEPKKGRSRNSVAWPFKSKDVEGMLDKIARYKQQMILALQFKAFRDTSMVDEHLRTLAVGQQKAVVNTDILVQRGEFENTQKILTWLSNYDSKKKHNLASRTRTRGTGEWILDQPWFNQWYSGSIDTLLAYGGPGVGKTILASFIVDHINLQRAISPFNKVGLIYVYLDYKQRGDQSYDAIVASLVKQLISNDYDHFPMLQALYSSAQDPLDSRPDTKTFEGLLKEIAEEFEQIYLVIDAFDESDSQDTRDELAKLITFLQSSRCKVKVLITSRNRLPSLEDFGNPETQELSASTGDIRTYIENRICNEQRLRRQLSDDGALRANVIDTVIDRCQGMFLMVALSLNALARSRTRADFNDCLQSLPSGSDGLRQTYRDAMDRIQSQDKQDVRYAMRILAWLCFSARPLKVLELRYALAIDSHKDNEQDFNENRLLPREDIEPLCNGLVVIDDNNEEVRLVHHTTQEFFNKEKEDLFVVEKPLIALSVIKFLSYRQFTRVCETDQELQQFKTDNPFLLYAVEHLGRHSLEAGSAGTEKVVELFRKISHLQCLNQIRLNLASPKSMVVCSPLCTAVEYNLMGVLQQLLKDKGDMPGCGWKTADVNIAGKAWRLRRFPAHEAASARKQEMLTLLLEHGVDLRCQDRHANTLLHACAVGHQVEGAKFCLEGCRDNINHQNANGNTPLHDAVCFGSDAVVRLLLEAKADVCISNGAKRSPIHEATAANRVEMVKLLVEAHRPDFAFQDGFKVSPLHCAAASNLSAEVEMILRERPDVVDLSNEPGLTPLHDTAERGASDCVSILLKHGANINRLDKMGRTPLYCAVEKRKPRVAKLLLDAGADVSLDTNAKAIAYQAGNTGPELIRMLLEHPKFDYAGVDKNTNVSGLNEASFLKHEETAMLFLERDEKEGSKLLHQKNNWGNTPMHDVAWSGMISVARRMLQTGSDILDWRNEAGEIPLDVAIKGGNHEVAELFRAKMAEMVARNVAS